MPYQYLEILNPRVSRYLIGSVWCFSSIWSVIGVYDWSQSNSANNKPPSNGIHFHKETDQSVYSIEVGQMCTNRNTLYFVISFFVIYVPTLIVMTSIYVPIFRTTLAHIRHIKCNTCVRGKINPTVRNTLAMVTQQLRS